MMIVWRKNGIFADDVNDKSLEKAIERLKRLG